MSEALREPLLHFALLGLALFLLVSAGEEEAPPTPAARTPDTSEANAPEVPSYTITISDAQLAALRAQHEAQYGAPPNEAQTEALLAQWVEDEILVREALRRELDVDDPIVRRRLIQKMTFVAEGMIPVIEPDEAALRAHLEAHPERFEAAERLTLRHVFFDDAATEDARVAEALAALEAGADAAELGDAFPHGRAFTHKTPEALDVLLGPGFGEALDALEVQTWSGPVASSYGQHLVYIESRSDPHVPALDVVEAEVRQDLVRELLDAALRESIAQLRARYEVVWP